MLLPFTRKKETLLVKVCKYECLLRHNSHNNANFTKMIRHITHMHVLYLLMLNFILKSIRPLSFRVYSVLVTWHVKYDRDLKVLEESSIEQTRAKSLSV